MLFGEKKIFIWAELIGWIWSICVFLFKILKNVFIDIFYNFFNILAHFHKWLLIFLWVPNLFSWSLKLVIINLGYKMMSFFSCWCCSYCWSFAFLALLVLNCKTEGLLSNTWGAMANCFCDCWLITVEPKVFHIKLA